MSEPVNLDYKALYEEEHARVKELTDQIIEITKALASRPVAASTTIATQTAAEQAAAPAGKKKSAQGKAADQETPEEEAHQLTKEEAEEAIAYYAWKAIEENKAALMKALAPCIPDEKHRLAFLQLLPDQTSLKDLLSIIKTGCDKGVILPAEAKKAKLAHIIFHYLNFDKPVQERYVNTEINTLLDSYL